METQEKRDREQASDDYNKYCLPDVEEITHTPRGMDLPLWMGR